MNSILEINKLTYTLPDVSVAAKQTQRTRSFAFPQNYINVQAGDVIPILVNSGKSYIDGRQSSLNFVLKANVSLPTDMRWFCFDAGFDNKNSGATVLNLIAELLIESRDGTLLYKENYLNIMQNIREYKISIEKKNMLTMIGGSYDTESWDDDNFPFYKVNLNNSFNIPLSDLCPMFNTSNLLLPELITGCKISLVLSQLKQNIVAINNNQELVDVPDDITFDITDVSLYLHQVDLYDGVQSVIKNSLTSLNKGLEFPYYCYHNSRFRPTSSSFTYDVQLSCQNVSYIAIKFFKRIYEQQTSPVASAGIYELRSERTTADDNALGFSIRARIGSQFYPNYPIVSATEAYINTCQALNPISFSDTQDIDVLKNTNKLSAGVMPYSNYCINGAFNDPVPDSGSYTSGLSSGAFLVAISLEKSNNVSLTGVQTTQGRTVSIDIQGLENYHLFDLYSQVQYLSVVTVTENNCIVSK
jgi:hypothetical protein